MADTDQPGLEPEAAAARLKTKQAFTDLATALKALADACESAIVVMIARIQCEIERSRSEKARMN